MTYAHLRITIEPAKRLGAVKLLSANRNFIDLGETAGAAYEK